MVKNKVAIFDFCGTFVPFQSADEFIRFSTKDFLADKTITKSEKKINFLERTKIIGLFNRLFHFSLKKRIIAQRISNMPLNQATDLAYSFVKCKIEPSLIAQTLSLLKFYQEKHVYLMLVSAAYDIYLSLFAKQHGFDFVVCTQLDHNSKYMTGKIKKDCVGVRKRKEAIKFLNRTFGVNNYEIVLSIGDSKTDIPILDIASRKIVISKKHQSWIKPNYEEIVYGVQKDD